MDSKKDNTYFSFAFCQALFFDFSPKNNKILALKLNRCYLFYILKQKNMSKHNFEAETWKILELLTHSIYSNKEIFLRELISNASDAIDKARLKSLTDTNFLWDDTTFKIKVTSDKEKNIILVEDNGIWMTEEELKKNIWTIAKSGTRDFIEKLKKAKEDGEHNLIWQFWVWFYSAFMVADKVQIETKSNLDEESFIWESDWKTGYEISKWNRKKRWTLIKLFIDEANKELLEEWKLRELIKKYSNYVAIPIMLEVEEKDDKWEVKWKKWEQVNETIAIWKKSKSDIKTEEYNEFYKTVSMDYNEPLTHIHNSVEWMVSYKSLLYIPKEKNLFANMSDPNREYWPKLYVQNVLILENAKELLPVWLRFVSWVVETSDLPLNISREMLQSNTVLDKIKKGLVKKVLSELKKTMAKDEEWYKKFLENYWQIIKEWIHYEWELKEDIASVVKFKSLLKNEMISLDKYLEEARAEEVKENDWCCGWSWNCSNKKEWDECCGKHKWDSCCKDEEKKEVKTIYYITWKSEAEVLISPYLEQFRKNNVDVILLTDPIDEWIIQAMFEYKWNKLKSVMSSDIKLAEETEEEKEKKEKNKKAFKDLLELIKNTIGTDKLEKVELNENLGGYLWAIKTPENWMTPQMEKMMKAMWQRIPAQKRILELNPQDKLIKSMQKEFKKDVKSKKLQDMISYSYYQAVLLEWWEVENIWEFIKLTNKFAGEYLK